MSTKNIIVYVTVGNMEEATKIARTLVEKALAACVGMIPQTSIYRWKGEIVEDSEVLLIIKTQTGKFARLSEAVLELHSYEVPEIISVDIKEGHEAYLKWMNESIKASD